MKLPIKIFRVIFFFSLMTQIYAELDIKALSQRKDLWPKEIVLLEKISYKSGKKFNMGSKFPLLEVNSNGIVFAEGKDQYRLSAGYTNLSLLVDESSLLQSGPLTAPKNLVNLEGPDFSFLLNTKVDFSEAERSKAIDLLLSQGGYLKAASQMGEALLKGFESGDSTSPGWTDRLYFARICSILGKNEDSLYAEKSPFPVNASQPLYKRFKPESLRFFLSSPPSLTKALLVLKSEDNLIGMFCILEDLHETYPDHISDYSALAGAFSIVYDQFIPRDWPHRQVKRSLVPLLEKEKPWITLFNYFQKKDQENLLATKPKEMSVSELKFTVDVPLQISELEWALKEARQSRGSFDKTYFDVKYDESRIKGRTLQGDWPHDVSYTLQNIKEKTGICIDQSYYASIAAKAFGIPSISISGQGANCAHAWLGFMPSGDKWNMKGGRYEANNYVVGFAWDPQTWNEINDHELEYISQRYSDSPEYYQSQSYLMLTQIDQGSFSIEQTVKIISEAKNICPKNPEPWFKLEKAFQQASQKEDLKNLYTQMAEQFSLQKDWKTLAQEGLAKLSGGSGDGTSDSSDINAKIIRDNKGKRADLAIAVASREALQKVQNENYEEAFEAYQNVIKKFGKENGLMIFNVLVDPFTAIALSKEQDELISKTLKSAEKLVDNTERVASLNQSKQHLDRLKQEVEEVQKAR